MRRFVTFAHLLVLLSVGLMIWAFGLRRDA